jgi:hypothetical protein
MPSALFMLKIDQPKRKNSSLISGKYWEAPMTINSKLKIS